MAQQVGETTSMKIEDCFVMFCRILAAWCDFTLLYWGGYLLKRRQTSIEENTSFF